MATFILLRHGQYQKKPKEMLTALGQKQARLAGKRLKEYSIAEIHHSTMPRAKETAEIVRKIIGPRKRLQQSDLLRECVPDFPKRYRKKAGFVDERMLRKSKRQAESAFKEFLTKKARSKKVILIVCHGNIIRYLICRTLAIDTLNWVKMDISQCGLSIVTFSPKRKKLELISHNDVGHIPLRHQTFL